MVYVCGRAFKDLAERNPERAQAIVIHEALHTLGLGENPPSSAEITARVLARCRPWTEVPPRQRKPSTSMMSLPLCSTWL